MAFSTNATNPLSAYNMTINNLTQQNLNNDRNINEERFKRRSISSSESESESNEPSSKTSIDKKKKYIKHVPLLKTQQLRNETTPASSGFDPRPLIFKDITYVPGVKNRLRLKKLIFPCCSIQ